MKKVWIGAGLLALTILLAGCGGNSTAKQASQSSSSTSQKVSSSHKQTTPWNSQKDDQLEIFINQCAPTMSQAYTKYNGKTALKTKLDVKYPKNFT